MENKFWHERWATNDIGFHLNKTNPILIKHWPSLQAKPEDIIFVPLCGKSLDLIWLTTQVKQVIACELSQQAIDDFFSENRITPHISQHSRYIKYQHENLTIFCGDFFELIPADLQSCTLIYDRASLIAFPLTMQQQYVDKLDQLFPHPHKRLLITLQYEQSLMQGPPFSVSAETVHQLFSTKHHCQCLESNSVIEQFKRFKDKGIEALHENVFILE